MPFQKRRLKCEKLKDDGSQEIAKAHIAFGKVSKKDIGTNNDLQNITQKTKDRAT
jgi:hypothetical protein